MARFGFRHSAHGLALALVAGVAHAQTAAPPPTSGSALGAPGQSIAAQREQAASTTPAASDSSKLSELDLLTFYKDNYFLTGFTKGTEVKFQFSAKFDIWPNRTQHAVYFAFSQVSLWDLYQPSQPFIENNYRPELFYTFFNNPGRYDPPPGCAFFMERIGLLHESNGEEGARSRGWNRVYGETRFACYDAARDYADVAVQAWLPFGMVDNPHITRYEGYGELSASVGRDQGRGLLGDWDFTVHARKGTSKRLSRGSVELDLRWRPRYGTWWRFTPYLYSQLFTGDAETLLTYDRTLTTFRVGIGLTDRSTRSE